MDVIEDRTKIPLCSEGKEDLRGWETRGPRRPRSGGTGERLECSGENYNVHRGKLRAGKRERGRLTEHFYDLRRAGENRVIWVDGAYIYSDAKRRARVCEIAVPKPRGLGGPRMWRGSCEAAVRERLECPKIIMSTRESSGLGKRERGRLNEHFYDPRLAGEKPGDPGGRRVHLLRRREKG